MEWYETDEMGAYDDEFEKKKLYETERTKNMEAEI